MESGIASLAQLLGANTLAVFAIWFLGKMAISQLNDRIEARFIAMERKLSSLDTLHSEINRVDKDLVQIRLEMATNFVRGTGLDNLTRRMEQLFKEVFDKLDSKADKANCPSLGHGK